MKKYANIVLHQSAHYRREVFAAGLRRHGYIPINDRNRSPGPNDLLVIWNRNPQHERLAQAYEQAGAKVIVTENGYLGKTKALALNHHGGAGCWHVGDEDRFSQLGIELQPWRKDGDFVLVLPQRSIGEPGVAMPRNWERQVLDRLPRITKRPIRLRKHPGKYPETTVEQDLKGAWAAVTWASGAGVKSIVAGVPVFHDLRKWIGAPAASGVWDIENPIMGNRMPMLHRLAWAQWTWDEIESGQAFGYLLTAASN